MSLWWEVIRSNVRFTLFEEKSPLQIEFFMQLGFRAWQYRRISIYSMKYSKMLTAQINLLQMWLEIVYKTMLQHKMWNWANNISFTVLCLTLMDGLHPTTVQQKEGIIPVLKEETGIDDTSKSPRILMTDWRHLLWRKEIWDPAISSWLLKQIWKTVNQE